MNANNSSTESPVATPHQAEPEQQRIGYLLYQGATVLAILLFLISFWSC